MKICIDAGHYGKYNRSPVNKAYYESDMAWKLHLYLKSELEAYGVTVITTRQSQDKDLALTSRGRAAKGCDLFLSIHSNACDTESVDKPVACCCVSGKADVIGQKLADTTAKIMGTKQPGTIWKRLGTNGDYYGVLRGAAAVGVPGVLMEHSFHTNKAATAWLLVDANLRKLAKAEAETIAKHYGLTNGSEKAENAAEKQQMYRVRKAWDDAKSQEGAYKVLENAKKKRDELGGEYTVYDADGKAVYPAEPEEYKVRVSIPNLNIRTGPGMQHPKTGKYTGKGVFTIVETQGSWGRLKAGGWISLNYATKI